VNLRSRDGGARRQPRSHGLNQPGQRVCAVTFAGQGATQVRLP
jgi:hypothetical protein